MEPVELMGKAAAVAVTAALCGAVLRRGAPELALLLSLAAGVWILLAAWDGLRETARLMEELALLAGLDRGVVEPVLKTVVLSDGDQAHLGSVPLCGGGRDRLLCGDGRGQCWRWRRPCRWCGVWWRRWRRC